MLPKRSTLSAMLLSSAAMACAVFPAAVRSQDKPATPPAGAPDAPAAEAPVPAANSSADPEMKRLAQDFLHLSVVGNQALARDTGLALLKKETDPKQVLVAFEEAADGRNVQTILGRNARDPILKEVSAKLSDEIEKGYREVSRDAVRIRADIDRLGDSARAYQNAREHLMAAGEFAVPYYIEYLQQNAKRDLHPYIIRVMTEIGRPLLPALVQQLQTTNDPEKLALIQVMGDIGYSLAVPYLKAVAADDKVLAEVRSAAENALVKIDEKTALGRGTAADSFQILAQAYYDGRPSVGPADATEATNPVWFYDKGLNNVVDKRIPTAIWNDVEAMRAAEMALKLENNKAASISLWVAANFRRELRLPAGATDTTRLANTPDATFYALAAGPVYLTPVLAIGLDDRNSPLILKTLSALEATGGTQGTVPVTKESANPLVRAMAYPDRAVRFNAAFALGRANPAKDFPGSFRVVPILCEAITHGTSPHVVLVDPNETNRARLRSILSDMNCVVHAGATLAAAMSDAAPAASFDAVIIPGPDALRLAELATTDYRLTSIPILVTGEQGNLDTLNTELAHVGPLYKAIASTIDAPSLQTQLDDMKKSIAVTPIDDAAATGFALTSIGILDTLAIDKQSIYHVTDAIPTLAEALKDPRVDVAIAAGGVLGRLNNATAQKAIADQIFAEDIDPKLQKALVLSLASSAKVAGNHVDPATIDKLIGLVTSNGDADLRAAAAKVIGALNVQSDQSSKLILQQMH